MLILFLLERDDFFVSFLFNLTNLLVLFLLERDEFLVSLIFKLTNMLVFFLLERDNFPVALLLNLTNTLILFRLKPHKLLSLLFNLPQKFFLSSRQDLHFLHSLHINLITLAQRFTHLRPLPNSSHCL